MNVPHLIARLNVELFNADEGVDERDKNMRSGWNSAIRHVIDLLRMDEQPVERMDMRVRQELVK